uniref:Uncharacterized protein n=1 Tax=Haptolina ericina TaxID=156174 RepID=A0A7S3ETI5_9EUKA
MHAVAHLSPEARMQLAELRIIYHLAARAVHALQVLLPRRDACPHLPERLRQLLCALTFRRHPFVQCMRSECRAVRERGIRLAVQSPTGGCHYAPTIRLATFSFCGRSRVVRSGSVMPL